VSSPPEARLRTVPWHALDGLLEDLGPALAATLAGKPADRTLDRFLRDHRQLSTDGRAACAEAIFGVSLWRRRLRALVGADATALQLLGALVRDLAGHPPPTATPDPSPVTDWRDLASIPDWLADELTQAFPNDATAMAAALNTPGPIFVRANTLMNTREQLAEKLRALGVDSIPTALARDGLKLTTARPNLLGLGLDGVFEVQDEGSQRLAELVDAKAGSAVLDLCAGAGGKALALAAHVGPSGTVHAADLDLARLERLRHRATKAHARIVIEGATCRPSLTFDRVLVDAPCSELGVLRRGPDVRWRLDPADFAPLPALQRTLLERGLSHLKPAGHLVYATCTFRRAENEAVVHDLPPGFTLLDQHTFRTDRDGTDCFYAAVIERTG
jgi:16S rRNA (cytosine967-C5)-methyltransferase